jgi:hypothetical protein
LVFVDVEKQIYFEDDFQRPNNPILAIQNFSWEIKIANSHLLHHNGNPKETINIYRKKPLDGLIKLNSDGACKGGGDTPGCGGLLCNLTGDGLKVTLGRLELVMPFMRKCGECTLALDLAWKKQISHFTGF